MLARLHEVGSQLWLKRDLRQALDEILAGAIELLNADMGTIRILNTTRGVLKIEAQRGFTQEFLDCFGEISVDGDSPCCRALRSADRIVIEDIEVDEHFTPYRAIARGAGYRGSPVNTNHEPRRSVVRHVSDPFSYGARTLRPRSAPARPLCATGRGHHPASPRG